MKPTTTYNLTTKTGERKIFYKGLRFNELVKWVETSGDEVEEYTIVQYVDGHARKTTNVKNY